VTIYQHCSASEADGHRTTIASAKCSEINIVTQFERLMRQPESTADKTARQLILDLQARLAALEKENAQLRLDNLAMQEREKSSRLLAENMADGVTILDKHRRVSYVSAAAVKQIGYAEQDELGRSEVDIAAWVHPDERDFVVKKINDAIQAKKPTLTYWYRVKHRSGHYIWREDVASYVYLGTGDYAGACVVSRDVTKRKQAEEQVHQLAYFDPLTRLPNRRMLHDRLRLTLAASKRSLRYGVVMMLDLDNFKPINDLHGHSAGDLLLVEVAQRLIASVRAVDTVSRFGGDEMVVVLGDLDADMDESRAKAQAIAEKIRLALAAPYLLMHTEDDGKSQATLELHCSASIGIVLFRDDELQLEVVLKHADMALYQAKDAGRNTIRFYQ
jgi:diguanylate cyclase (GGDEF)-like protein/PAS domain S-box-containing protein